MYVYFLQISYKLKYDFIPIAKLITHISVNDQPDDRDFAVFLSR